MLKRTDTWGSPHVPPEIARNGPFFSALTWGQQMEGQLGSLSHVTTNVVVPLHAQITHAHIHPFMVRTGQDPVAGGVVLVTVTAAISVAGPVARCKRGRLC